MSASKPPRFAEALLNWLVQDDLQTPLGDFEEYFHELEQEYGAAHAQRWYRRQVLQLVPERLVQNMYWSLVMLKNYLVLAYRNIIKKPLVSGINLIGLSLAIACTVVAYLFIMGHTTNERIHAHSDTIFLAKSVYEVQGERKTSAQTPAPMGPALATEFPQVQRSVRMHIRYGQVDTGGEEPFGELVTFVDPGFLDLFTFPVIAGEAGGFGDPSSVVLSELAATKFFGEADPIGQPLTISVEGIPAMTVYVRAVTETNRRSSLSFTILLPYPPYLDLTAAGDDWGSRAFTFVQLPDADAADALAGQMDGYIAAQRAAVPDLPVQAYRFENLVDLGQHIDDIGSTFVHSIPWPPIIALSLIALFLLTLSCINYVNISLSTAVRRVKEIGMRKVVGGSRHQLARQFLAENVVLCGLALVVGIAIAHFLLIPSFNTITESDNSLGTAPISSLLLFLGCLLFAIALASGAYPALYMASFRPIAIFQGSLRMNRRNRFMQSLLTLQFVLAFVTMIVCTGLLLNAHDERSRDWGYNPKNVLYVDLEQTDRFEVMRDYAASLPQIVSIAGSEHHVSRDEESRDVTVRDQKQNTTILRIGAGYAETMGLRLQAGRFFDSDRERQSAHELVVNEAFARTQGWDDPVGQTVRIDSVAYDIIGEVADFHVRGFMADIRPTIFRLADPADYRLLAVHVEDGAGPAVAQALRERAGALWGDRAVEVAFQEAAFDRHFSETRGINQIFLFTALLALMLSCMGLFGLAAQNTLNRMKEIGIRKVLGASIAQLATHLNRRFAILLAAAAVLASPLGYLLLNALLDSIYTYHMGVGPAAFLIAYALVFVTGLMTLGTQVYQMAVTDPVVTLRSE
ncbi:MAG: ABC transporter permease [Rhodothermales bacterium]